MGKMEQFIGRRKKDTFNYPKGFEELTSDEYDYVIFDVKPFDYDENTLKLWEYENKHLEIVTKEGKIYRGYDSFFGSRVDNDSNEDDIAMKVNYIGKNFDFNDEKFTLYTLYNYFCFDLSEIDKLTITDDIPYIKYLAEFVTIHTSNGVYTGFVEDIKKHEDFYELSINIYFTFEEYKLDSEKILNLWWNTYQVKTKDINEIEFEKTISFDNTSLINEIELEKRISIENIPVINLNDFLNHDVTLTTIIGNKYTGYVTGIETKKRKTHDVEILKMDIEDFNVNLDTDTVELGVLATAATFKKSIIASIEIKDEPKLSSYAGKYVELTTQSLTRFKGFVSKVQYDHKEESILLEVDNIHEWLTTDTKVSFESENTSQCYLFKKSEIIAIKEWRDDTEENTTCKQER
ncbi:hypothetical protein MUA90_10660 [Staphylococcus sp. IVB6181]|nr:hypothetical protein MUA90_10660 [Staphylococcus sp. IVB6181]